MILGGSMATIDGMTASVAGVPALLRYRGSPELAMEQGTVLFYHGFAGTKERAEDYLTALAEERAISLWA
jgi:hypothetical protein